MFYRKLSNLEHLLSQRMKKIKSTGTKCLPGADTLELANRENNTIAQRTNRVFLWTKSNRKSFKNPKEIISSSDQSPSKSPPSTPSSQQMSAVGIDFQTSSSRRNE